jgi:predicted aldo/keto reductase-like oxidoreductase
MMISLYQDLPHEQFKEFGGRKNLKKNALGRTGLEVTELSLGTLIFGRIQANLSVEEGAKAVSKALELGINFIDTAASYGSQLHVREGLKGYPGEIFISTKSHGRTREAVRKDFETSLKELGRDHIDLYQMHLVNSTKEMEERRDVLQFLLELKQKGLIRAIGASVHRVEGARAVVAEEDIDVLFPVMNSNGLGIIDGTIDEMISVCRQAKERGMGIIAMKPLGGGHLRKAVRESFEFLQRLGIVDTICVGMKNPAEVEMNLLSIEGRQIPVELLKRIETTTRVLRIYERCIGCGSCVEECAQAALSIDLSKADASKKKKGQAVVDNTRCILCGYCAEACPEFALRVI